MFWKHGILCNCYQKPCFKERQREENVKESQTYSMEIVYSHRTCHMYFERKTNIIQCGKQRKLFFYAFL